MPCVAAAPGVVVTMADSRYLKKRYLHCPVCECITEMVERHEAWYGTTTYCCKCGDTWQDGDLGYRPFARGWRAKAAAYHRKLWDQATFGPAPAVEDLYPDYRPSVVTVELPGGAE